MTLISCTLHLARTKPAVLRRCTEMGGEVCGSGVGVGGGAYVSGGARGSPARTSTTQSQHQRYAFPSAVTDAPFLHLFPAR